jgi:hypothetical protein
LHRQIEYRLIQVWKREFSVYLEFDCLEEVWLCRPIRRAKV